MTKRFSILNIPISIFSKHEDGKWIWWYIGWEYRQLCHLQPFYQTHPALLDTQQLSTIEQRGEILGLKVWNWTIFGELSLPQLWLSRCVPHKKGQHLMTSKGNIPPLCSVDSQIFHPWPIWSGHSKHSRAEEQPSCWLEVSRKGNPSIFSVGYCQLINREIGASSSLNTLSTHSTHFLAAENTIFIYTILSQYKPFYGQIISASHTERVIFVPTLFVVGEVVVVVAQESPLDWVCLGLGHSNRGGVGHRGHGGCWEHQGWHVNTVTHRPENSKLCRTELN